MKLKTFLIIVIGTLSTVTHAHDTTSPTIIDETRELYYPAFRVVDRLPPYAYQKKDAPKVRAFLAPMVHPSRSVPVPRKAQRKSSAALWVLIKSLR